MSKKAKKTPVKKLASVDVDTLIDQPEITRLRVALDAANVAIARQAKQIMDLKRMKGVKV